MNRSAYVFVFSILYLHCALDIRATSAEAPLEANCVSAAGGAARHEQSLHEHLVDGRSTHATTRHVTGLAANIRSRA